MIAPSRQGTVLRTAGVCLVIAAAASALACSPSVASARLLPDTPTTLLVGETAAVEVSSDRQYSIGSAGSSLALVKQMQRQETTVYIYRAVGVGHQTLVATPGDPGPDGCVSCVTVHYFITVIR
jgi:hypothetical protein